MSSNLSLYLRSMSRYQSTRLYSSPCFSRYALSGVCSARSICQCRQCRYRGYPIPVSWQKRIPTRTCRYKEFSFPTLKCSLLASMAIAFLALSPNCYRMRKRLNCIQSNSRSNNWRKRCSELSE